MKEILQRPRYPIAALKVRDAVILHCISRLTYLGSLLTVP
jgi:hypothetical protein